MNNICLYFQIHHPFIFQTYRFFDIGTSKSYYDDLRIEREIQEAAANYYLPSNDFLLKLIRQSNNKLKLAFSISGTTLDQFLIYTPELLNSFRQLADTGQVEFTTGTNSHSLVSLSGQKNEFKQHIKQHRERIESYFDRKAKVFINTDLLYSNQIAETVSDAGFHVILTNGTKKILQWRSPNYLYSAEHNPEIRILFRNETISNELWSILQNPKSTEKATHVGRLFSAIDAIQADEPILNIYLNYQVLGGKEINEKQHFFRSFIAKIINGKSFYFSLPSEVVEHYGPVAQVGTEEPVCWVEGFHTSYFPGNELQKDALNQLFKLEKQVAAADDPNVQIDWKYLQTSDHFHLLDENHPIYTDEMQNQGHYKSKYDAYINYMNILEDFRQRVNATKTTGKPGQDETKTPKHIN